MLSQAGGRVTHGLSSSLLPAISVKSGRDSGFFLWPRAGYSLPEPLVYEDNGDSNHSLGMQDHNIRSDLYKRNQNSGVPVTHHQQYH